MLVIGNTALEMIICVCMGTCFFVNLNESISDHIPHVCVCLVKVYFSHFSRFCCFHSRFSYMFFNSATQLVNIIMFKVCFIIGLQAS